jgi:hypothetical protein
MIVLGIDPRIREMRESIREQERLLSERLLEVQTPDEFRALVRMRMALYKTRDELIEKSLALGHARGGPECFLVTAREPPAGPKRDIRREVLARHGHCSDLNFGLATATIERLPFGFYRFGYYFWWNEGVFSKPLGAVSYRTAARATQAAIRAVLKQFPKPYRCSRPHIHEQLADMRAQIEAKLIVNKA